MLKTDDELRHKGRRWTDVRGIYEQSHLRISKMAVTHEIENDGEKHGTRVIPMRSICTGTREMQKLLRVNSVELSPTAIYHQ